jgi:putative glutamine amidotransferase
MSKRPLIGLNTALMELEAPLSAKALCHLKYIDAVAAAGGVPIVIPSYTDETLIEEALAVVDGFCLIGGKDYNPAKYGGHPQPEKELLEPRRNVFDLWLGEQLLKKTSKPVLGICGGHQLINITYGGALIQDVASEWKPLDQQASTLLHSSDERKGTPQADEVYRHEVKLGHTSLIAQIIGSGKVITNSYHHQAVDPKRIGEGLMASAWAPDGVVEAIELKNRDRFLLGVQWHPERQTEQKEHAKIFEALVAASAS